MDVPPLPLLSFPRSLPPSLYPMQVYKDKLKELRRVSRALFKRVSEAEKRPKLMANFASSLNVSHDFLARMKNLSSEVQIFTEVEISTLENLVEEAEVCGNGRSRQEGWKRNEWKQQKYGNGKVLGKEVEIFFGRHRNEESGVLKINVHACVR